MLKAAAVTTPNFCNYQYHGISVLAMNSLQVYGMFVHIPREESRSWRYPAFLSKWMSIPAVYTYHACQGYIANEETTLTKLSNTSVVGEQRCGCMVSYVANCARAQLNGSCRAMMPQNIDSLEVSRVLVYTNPEKSHGCHGRVKAR